MAELMLVVTAIGIAKNVVYIVNGLKGVVDMISGIKKAPTEAKHVTNQLEAATAILTSIKSSLEGKTRSPEFLKVWGGSAHVVLVNINTTLSHIKGKLRKRGIFGAKVQWNYEKKDAFSLQQTLQGYMQMLAMVQNGLLQEDMRVLQVSANRIEDIVAGKSDGKSLPPVATAIEATTSDAISSIDTGDDVVLPGGKKFKILASWAADDFHIGRLKETSGLVEVKHGDINRAMRTQLGKGKVTFALNGNRTQLWVIYRPDKSKLGESRWYHSLNANQFKLELVTDYDHRCTLANPWDFFYSDDKYKSDRPGVSFKGVCLFLAGLQADTKDQFQNSKLGDWAIEIALKPQSKNLKLLKAFGDQVEVASKKKAAAEWAARMSTTNSSMKAKRGKS